MFALFFLDYCIGVLQIWSIYTILPGVHGGATSQKVAGSISDGVIGIFH